MNDEVDQTEQIVRLLTEIRDDQRERLMFLRDQAKRATEVREEAAARTKDAVARSEIAAAKQAEGLNIARDNSERAKRTFELIEKSLAGQRWLITCILIAGFVALYFLLRKP